MTRMIAYIGILWIGWGSVAFAQSAAQPIVVTLPDTAVCYTYQWGDTTIITGGTYTRTFTAASGADSIVTQTVTINYETYGTDNVTAYDSYTWINGKTYTKSIGGPIWYITNAAGCDSVVTLNLKIRHLKSDTVSETICSRDLPYVWHGLSLTESGQFASDTVLDTSPNAMDTVHVLNLTVLQSGESEQSISACESYTWNGQTYTESGDYTYTTTGINGCDSVATLHLIINKTTTSEEQAEQCISYTWNGQTYTESGDYTWTTTNAAGCDSTATLHLTILTPTTSEEQVEQCISYTWHGTTYTESGDYTWTTQNAAGCDSVVTLHLTIQEECATYDTVYFCPGMNSEHEEHIEGAHFRRYMAYTYQSPEEWDYMGDAVLSRESDGALVDLHQVEENLHAHYTDNLTPVKSVTWSYRADGSTSYQSIEVTDQPQWIATGKVVMIVRFVCGQVYTSDFATDVENIQHSAISSQKIIRNGQVIIIRGGVEYNILGLKIGSRTDVVRAIF